VQRNALYRKHRPLTFSDVVGQEHITKTLKKQIMTGNISHAYLFTGTRGTGKTTCAKIFSRAINCLNPKDGEPCNECAACKGILDGSVFDVAEIDAASNNGVDDVRELRDNVIYAPVFTKHKVYIIDEVHMLSTAAFNALLKTLEEPPEHTVFILATTEPRKVPATILSRCQRYDFFRVSYNTLKERIEEILRRENITIDKSSVSLVASLADGSVRDALSILDKVIEMENPDQIEYVLGAIGKRTLWTLAESIASGDTDKIYEQINSLYSSSKDMSILIDEMTTLFRNMLVVKSSSNPEKLIDASDEEIETVKRLSELFGEKQIMMTIRSLIEAHLAVSRGADARTEAELCLVSAARPSMSQSSDSLIARIEVLERAIKNGIAVKPAEAKPITEEKKEIPVPENKPTEKPVEKTTEPEKKPDETEAPKEEIKPEIPKNEPKATGVVESTPSDDQWKELESLGEIAKKTGDLMTRFTLESCRAVYRGNDIIILTKLPDDVTTLKANLDKVIKAFEEDRKVGRNITVTSEPITKYIKEQTITSIDNNPMFEMM